MDNAQDADDDELVVAYHRFRRADSAYQSRLRTVTGMSENEVRLVEYLLSAERAGREVRPTQIARHLGISSASTTALLDRLERSGSLERAVHPTDRRSILIAPTAAAEDKLASTVDRYEQELRRLSRALEPRTRASVAEFLRGLADAAGAIARPEERSR